MCEEAPAIKALTFLQNEVSSVVDHHNPEESTVFRSLLSHLLIPIPKPMPPVTSRKPSDPHENNADSDSEDSEAPPKKRSRQSSPGEIWTNRLDDDKTTDEPPFSLDPSLPSSDGSSHRSRAVLDFKEDPDEKGIRDSSISLSPERFQQRTEIFESLLEFVGTDAKQPSGSLLDMVNGADEL